MPPCGGDSLTLKMPEGDINISTRPPDNNTHRVGRGGRTKTRE
jgi:hypothetical protein